MKSFLSKVVADILTKKEVEIAEQVVEGKPNVEIQDALFISKSTLKTHLNNIYKKIPFLKKTRDSD